jgi:putative peptidoglycan lipid II flippase
VKAPGLLRSSAVFSAMTLLSRLAGLARDMLQARLFGAGIAADAFVIAYRIPNYLRRIFAEGSFAAAFVPVFSELKTRGDTAALKDFVDHVAGALFAIVLVVTGIGILAAPMVVAVMAPGVLDEPARADLTADMLRIVFPYLPLISLAALAGGVLNSFQRFALPAVTPVLHNLMVIAAMLFLAPLFAEPAKALAWGVLLAGFAQVLLLWPALGRLGLRPRLRLDLKHAGVRRVFALMVPTLFSSSVAQLNLIVGTAFASLLATGSPTWLYMSDRLVEFPLGLFGVALGTVILPHLARQHALVDDDGYSRALDWGLRTVVLLGVPAGLGLLLLAEPLSVTLYEGGRFTAYDARMASWSLAAMSIGVPAFMASKVLLPAFYARQDTRTPMRIAIWTVVVNVLLTIALTTPLWLQGIEGGHVGIALATGLAGVLNAFLLWRALRRDRLYVAQPGWARHLLRIAVASIAMVAAVWFLRQSLGEWSALPGWHRWFWLLGAVGIGAGAFGLTLMIVGWRPRELRHG